MERQNVAPLPHFVDRQEFHIFDVLVMMGGRGDDVHAERRRDSGDAASDPAAADEPEGHSVEFGIIHVLVGISGDSGPHTVADDIPHSVEVGVQREEHLNCELSDRGG